MPRLSLANLAVETEIGGRVDPAECRWRLGAARVARLATVDAAGVPHLVPVTFGLAEDEAFTAVDAKPKRTSRLKRLDNVRTTGRACMLADFYDEDWSRLWWVRADATAQVLGPGPQAARALALLAGKYPQYADAPPGGPVIALRVIRWTGWAAS